MLKRKKRGSSLVIVVMIMAILFTVGTAVLTLASSNYKMRINSSKKIENLYSADSGLNTVYNIILKSSEAAIIYANQEVKKIYDGKKMTMELYNEINEYFKDRFISFLGISAPGMGEYIDDSMLAIAIFEGKYKVFDRRGGFDWEKKVYNDDKYAIKLRDYKYNTDKNTIEVVIESTFETKNNEIKNKRVLETKYEVIPPDYKELSVSENVTIGIYPVFDEKVITTDGNLTVNSDTTVVGDIWVKGTDELKDTSYVFDKYKGGVLIENNTLDLEGDLITNRTLHLKNLAKASIKGDVYALNTYVGKSDKVGSSTGNTLDIDADNGVGGNLIVNNDLAMNTTNSTIKMNNFYGINENRDRSAANEINNSLNDIKEVMNSSSIIVNNTDETSKLEVKEDAYIMGVAYINTLDEKYQTGESVAIKGNYKAYTEVLPGYENKVTLKYYNPLQLIESIDGEEKSDYFKKYYELNKKDISRGGVKLNNVYSVGASYSTENNSDFLWNKSINEEEKLKVLEKRNEFAKDVFSMGYISDTSAEEIYADGKVKKTVSNQIKFDAINPSNVIDESYGKLKLNKNSSRKIVIKGEGDNTIYDIKEYDVIDASAPLNAIIITNGDVIVSGKINFTGNIITAGNIEFVGNGDKRIKYDENVTRRIIAANYENIKEVFIDLPISSHIVYLGDKIDIGGIIDTEVIEDQYNLNKIVDDSNWKIVK